MDVLVVGAGPGGSSTAYHLARQGLDVVMVDKARFPRDKVCGDGLTPYGVRAISRMGIDTDDPAFTRVDGLRTYGINGVVIDLPFRRLKMFPSYGLVRTRYDFDHLLAMRAEKAGARFLQGVEATQPVMDGGWVAGAVLKEDGSTREVRARFVVAADGASSRFSQHVGVTRDSTRPLGIAARRYYRIPREDLTMLEAFLNLRDEPTGGIMAGYGWIFPLGGGLVNVGAGLLNTFKRFKEISAKKMMGQFLRELPPEWGIDDEHAEGPLLSGPIPMAMNRRPLAVPGLLVVGDAGGLVNPFNGEGIAYAVETGETAAELLGDALKRDRPGIAQMYPTILRKRYGRYYMIGTNWVRLIGHPRFMRFCVEHGFPRQRLMEFAITMMTNITDGKEGGVDDRLLYALKRLAPERPLGLFGRRDE